MLGGFIVSAVQKEAAFDSSSRDRLKSCFYQAADVNPDVLKHPTKIIHTGNATVGSPLRFSS